MEHEKEQNMLKVRTVLSMNACFVSFFVFCTEQSNWICFSFNICHCCIDMNKIQLISKRVREKNKKFSFRMERRNHERGSGLTTMTKKHFIWIALEKQKNKKKKQKQIVQSFRVGSYERKAFFFIFSFIIMLKIANGFKASIFVFFYVYEPNRRKKENITIYNNVFFLFLFANDAYHGKWFWFI